MLMLQKVLRVKSFLFVCFFVSLLCKMTTPDIDHIFCCCFVCFLYQLLVTQSLEQPNFNF